MDIKYEQFIRSKRIRAAIEPVAYDAVSGALYPFQRELVSAALERGRSALFADCGLGKTLMELEFGTNTPGRTLILAPLAVSHQIAREAEAFGFDAVVRDESSQVDAEKITITNYEKTHRFDPAAFDAVILDESSILKSYSGKTRAAITEAFARHKYKLAASATPAPNDFMELGTHAEFFGVMTRAEMLSMFFVHDGGSTQNWRLKGHAERDFWQWVGSWASMIRKPSDMGFDDGEFSLPPLVIHHHPVGSGFTDGSLFPGQTALDLHGRRRARRSSIVQRSEAARSLDNGSEQFLYWVDLNDESKAVKSAVDGCVEVCGADSDQHKVESMLGFSNGTVRTLVTKPRIGGWGMNWQMCSNMAFVGLSDSYEAFYQCTRRCWRFGQKNPVDVHLIYSEPELAVVDNVLAKEARHEEMQDALIAEVQSQ